MFCLRVSNIGFRVLQPDVKYGFCPSSTPSTDMLVVLGRLDEIEEKIASRAYFGVTPEKKYQWYWILSSRGVYVTTDSSIKAVDAVSQEPP